MIKTLSKAQKMEREKFRIPRSVQDAIPIRRIFADGIFQVGNQYSKTWSFTDINYAIASKEDKTSMFLDYSELLNALDSGASAKITIYNRRINKAEFERSVLLPDRDDGLDEYRHEFNQMLTAQVTGTSNSIVRERYLTVSVVKRNADEARSYFARVGTDLVTHLAQLSSVAQELTLIERLHIFRDFFKAGEQAAAEFNIHKHAKRGQHFKDWFCPDSMEFAADHFKLDARYGRVLYLQDYASYIKDSFVSELCDLDRDLMLSIDILPVPTDEAARQLQSTLLGVETNVANWQRRQNANNNFTATIETTNDTGQPTSTTITETVLEIELTHKTPAEMAADYHFNTRQSNYLQLLQDPQYEQLWAELLGGYAQGDGEILTPDSTRAPTGTLQWPLPVAGTITSQFGHRVDPITGEVSSHTGTDIACAEGTPILAAAEGTVTVANGLDSWGGSYGYYVQIDHGGGLETLYAHCSSICVTTGQQVQAGQIIGYVGHTGRATGSHLHLEVRINGNRANPLQHFL